MPLSAGDPLEIKPVVDRKPIDLDDRLLHQKRIVAANIDRISDVQSPAPGQLKDAAGPKLENVWLDDAKAEFPFGQIVWPQKQLPLNFVNTFAPVFIAHPTQELLLRVRIFR